MTAILPLSVHAAQVRRRGKTIVGPIDLDLDTQGTTIVIGPNGAGKTTLLHMLHGLARLSQGTVAWNTPTQDAQTKQAFVFQAPVVLRRSVRDNIAYPLILHGVLKSEARRRAEDWAARVGLAEALKRPATVLSGGEKQKLALARALIREPQVLFLDEPTANLDGRSTREIETILHRTAAEGTRIVMTTHNIGQAQRLASEVIFLYRGRVHEMTRAEAFFKGPRTPEAAAFIKGDIVE
ncbi:MAG: ATP-binding cassette domain-containing protein [Rhodobacter sp.]|nr:ATP-binding cassette domain-containing protein [Rhodobacter sp.]